MNYPHFTSTPHTTSAHPHPHHTSQNYVGTSGASYNYGSGNSNNQSNSNYARPKRSSSKQVKPVVNNFVEPGRAPARKTSMSSNKKPSLTGSASKNPNSSVFANKRNSNATTESCA